MSLEEIESTLSSILSYLMRASSRLNTSSQTEFSFAIILYCRHFDNSAMAPLVAVQFPHPKKRLPCILSKLVLLRQKSTIKPYVAHHQIQAVTHYLPLEIQNMHLQFLLSIELQSGIWKNSSKCWTYTSIKSTNSSFLIGTRTYTFDPIMYRIYRLRMNSFNTFFDAYFCVHQLINKFGYGKNLKGMHITEVPPAAEPTERSIEGPVPKTG